MPVQAETAVGGGTQFAVTWTPDPTGSRLVRVRIKSISFYTGSTITSWTLGLSGISGHTPTLYTDTTATFWLGGSGGLIDLPNLATDTDQPMSVTFVTVGMAAAGSLVIDYDLVREGGP